MIVADACGLVPTRDLVAQPLERMIADCANAMAGGDRLCSLFGRACAGDLLVTAILQQSRHGFAVLRGRAPAGSRYPSLTPQFPAAHLVERELFEQSGLTPDGHPWLKPLRFDGAQQGRMHTYPFFSVRGHDVHEVGVGPIHAGVIEPGHFRFMCHGERVLHLEIQLGYQHRGVETLLLQRPVRSLTPLVECIAGDSSIAYAWGHCTAIEALSGATLAPEAERVRGVALELERIAMHLATLAGLATDIAFLQGGSSYGRLRTAIINASMRSCGSRFGRGWLRPGGVRCGVDDLRRQDLLDTLAAFAHDIAEVNALMLGARSVRSRFRGTGKLSAKAARELGLVGLAARASGVAIDARADLAPMPYAERPLAVLVEEDGDCLARARLRMREIDESVRWLQQLLAAPAGVLADRASLAPIGPLRGDAIAIAMHEGCRGQVLHALETASDGTLLRYKVADPSASNWLGLALAMRDNDISDFPICNKSFDLSYCGNDL
ncbi:MAG: NADH-quinone oxidoreductase subunit C [Xanthomonadales bacterium]|nr:NADH-quinone oxidoreductase subunit C [Xanthomonadales bacterium]